MPSGQTLTPDQMRILLIHMIRDPKTIDVVSNKITPDDFDDPMEQGYRAIWEISLRHWKEHKVPIAYPYMVEQLTNHLETSASFQIEAEKKNLLDFIDIAYRWDTSILIPEIAINLAQLFLDQKRVLSVTQSDLPAAQLVTSILDGFYASRLDQHTEKLDIMAIDSPFYASEERNPTGCMFFDEILGGGICPGEAMGLLGPSGGGKTTLALQIACEVARQGQHVCFFTYEQVAAGELSTKMYSYLSNTDRKLIEGKRFDAIDKAIISKIDAQRTIVGPYLHTFNFCSTKAGQGGPDEIDSRIHVEDQEGRRPALVIVDWILPMVQRWIGTLSGGDKIGDSATRMHIQSACDKLHQIAVRYQTTVLIVHQLSGVAAERKPNQKPQWTDAAEAKAFAWLLSYCLAIGTRDLQNNCMYLVGSKSRSSAPDCKIIRLEGAFNRFTDATSTYTTNPRGGKDYGYFMQDNNQQGVGGANRMPKG